MHAAIKALSAKGSIITQIDTKEQDLSDWFIEVMIKPITDHVVPETLELVMKHLSNWCNSSIAELFITCVGNEVTSQYVTSSAKLNISEQGRLESKNKDAVFSIVGIRDSPHIPEKSARTEVRTSKLFPDWADRY